ncbi:MAG: GPP34 family phosphoprotein [Solirubrobacteraceae bacterium]|nr:GPP34 family phosphoprotein [Solirubrobacteraceae bacterium]
MTDVLLAEELLLIALDDDKGTTSSMVSLDPGLAGALLLDLIAAGALVESGDALEVVDGAGEPSHPLLIETLGVIRAKATPKKAKHWIDRLPRDRALKPLKGRIADSLVSRGVLDEKRHKTLGIIPSTRYPEVDPAPERELRARLEATLVEGVEPAPPTARLVALIHAIGLVPATVPKGQGRAAKARAKEIAASNAVGAAVKRAVDDVGAAVAASAAAAAVAGSS